MKLRELQELLEQQILGKGDPVSTHIAPGGTLNASEAVTVYSRAYALRLTEALGEIYEAVWRVLGDETFFEVAADYIETHPSRSHNLSHYGSSFPDFLSARFPETELLKDLAAFEWGFADLFHKPEETGLEATELAGMTPAARIEFVDSLFLLDARSPVYSVWQLREHPEPPELDFSQPEAIFACKKNGQIFIRESTSGELQLARLLREGKTIENALAESTITPAEVEGFFSFIAQARLIRRIFL
ncbi:MAG: putative DNA-binding domain-containing protein [Leptospirales bacterium]|nr:putative DNA-binding domain-containing protein [Leptospirales bacterium]